MKREYSVFNSDDLDDIFGITGGRSKATSFRDRNWRTKDGRITKIREMADQHVMNCIRYYRRKWLEENGIKYQNMTPEQLEERIHRGLYRHHPQYPRVYKEAVVRGLIVDMKCLMTEISAEDLEYRKEREEIQHKKSLFNMNEFLGGPDDDDSAPSV